VAYGADPGSPATFNVPEKAHGRDGLAMLASAGYAINYDLPKGTAATTTRVQLSVKYSTTSMLLLLVQLVSRDGKRTVARQLKIELEGGHPRQTEQHPDYPKEKIVWVESQQLGEGWVALDLWIEHLANAAWGADGFEYDRLRGFLLRGVIAVSPVSLLPN
jgi:hypothetical protein